MDIALAGGSDSLCEITYSGFNALRAVDDAPCRPFREGRAGMSIGEGAGVLVLESLAHARARGAEPLAELRGSGASCDASHMTAPHPEGAGAALALARAFADARLDPDEVDFINAHGTGTPLNDVAEFAAFKAALGPRASEVPLTSTKGVVGHLLGSSGAIEAIATVLGLRDREVHADARRRARGSRHRRPSRPRRTAGGAGGADRRLDEPGLRRLQRRPRPRALGLTWPSPPSPGSASSAASAAGPAPSRRRCAPRAPVLSPVDRSAGYHLPESARTAALIGGADLTAWVPAAMARRMSPPSKLAVAAARMATAEAGGHAEAGITEVVMATAFGPASFTERLLRGILAEGPETASPFLFTECVANAPAAQVAIACQARGPNITVTQREAGPLLALGRAAADVATGSVARALAGAVDESPPIVHALLDRYGALSRPSADGGEAARPFDRRRSGFYMGEGATVIVVEDEAAARARGARILCRVRAWGSGFDPSASRVSWGRGHEPLARAARRMLDRAGLAPRDIDLVVSGASGSVAGDRLEADTLHALWGEEPLPPVLAPKGRDRRIRRGPARGRDPRHRGRGVRADRAGTRRSIPPCA